MFAEPWRGAAGTTRSQRPHLSLPPAVSHKEERDQLPISQQEKKKKREKKRRKRGFVSSLGYIFIASRYCNICADYQINQQIAEPIK